MAKPKKGELRQEKPNGRVAIATGPGVTAGDWFVFDPDNGGHYTDGERDGVAEWKVK